MLNEKDHSKPAAMEAAVILLSLFCIFLVIDNFFTASKSHRQALEIDRLNHDLDSLKFSRYLDSLSVASYNNARRILEFQGTK